MSLRAILADEGLTAAAKLKIRPQRWNSEFDFEGDPETAKAVLAYLGLPKSKVRCINSEDDEDFEEFQNTLDWSNWSPPDAPQDIAFEKAEKNGRKYIVKGEWGMHTLYGPADGFVLTD